MPAGALDNPQVRRGGGTSEVHVHCVLENNYISLFTGVNGPNVPVLTKAICSLPRTAQQQPSARNTGWFLGGTLGPLFQ